MDERQRTLDDGASADASGGKATASDKDEAAEMKAEDSESADADEDTARLLGLGVTVTIRTSDGFDNGRAAESEAVLREEEFLRNGSLFEEGEGAITQPLLSPPAPPFE